VKGQIAMHLAGGGKVCPRGGACDSVMVGPRCRKEAREGTQDQRNAMLGATNQRIFGGHRGGGVSPSVPIGGTNKQFRKRGMQKECGHLGK